jgi:hypothetical protein
VISRNRQGRLVSPFVLFLRRGLVVLALLGLTLAACAKKQTPTSTGTPEASPTAAASPTATAASGTKFEFDLTGSEEKPGPGDTDGKGKAQITLDEAGKKVCFETQANAIGAPDKGHIHEGAKGIAGPISVPLFTSVVDNSEPFEAKGCVDADAALIARIKSQPQNFYVNLHNPEFPNGAIRGQLPATPAGAGAATPTGGGGSTPTSTGGY